MEQHQTFSALKPLQQVAFSEPANMGLGVPKGVDHNKWATHLAHLSAREPNNLLNHVRRVYLHLARNQADELYGAMLDLHLVLGDNGNRLRARLLRQSRTLLSEPHYNLFLTHYKHGLQRNQSLPASRYSVLGNFFDGKMSFLKQYTSDKQPINESIDPCEQAREEIIHGDVDAAQSILEKALIRSPDRKDLHLELLELYSHTRSLSDLMDMQERLGDGIAIAQTEWSRTRQLLEN
ncbi:MAG: hypothetical protein P8179_11730 [Candidatus Thiodiazotropha sp.]